MTLLDVAPGPGAKSSYVLAGKAPFPMGRVSLCRDGECGEVFTYEDIDGLRIQSIATDSTGDGVWVVAGSPLIYQGQLYYCTRGRFCRWQASFKTLEDAEGQRVNEVEDLEDLEDSSQQERASSPEDRCDDLRESLAEQLRLAEVEEETARKMLKTAMVRNNCE